MILLIVGLLSFIALHSLRAHFAPLRQQMIDRLGLIAFRSVFSLATLFALAAIGIGLEQARQTPHLLWQPPMDWRMGMLHAMWFVALGFAARWVPGTHLRIWLKQPVLLAIILWGLLHLSVAAFLHQWLVFGLILVWALFALVRDWSESIPAPISWSRDLLAVVLATILWYGFAHYLHAMLIGVPVISY